MSTSRKVCSYDHIQWVQHGKHTIIQFFYHKNPHFNSFSLSLFSFSSPSLLSSVVRKTPLKKILIFSKNNFDFLFKNLIFQYFFYFTPKNSHLLFQKIMIFSPNILILPLKISDFLSFQNKYKKFIGKV